MERKVCLDGVHPKHLGSVLTKGMSVACALALGLTMTTFSPLTAEAASTESSTELDALSEEYPDVLLGVFTNSAKDSTDTIYMSTDGLHFEKISEAFTNIDPNDASNSLAVGSGSDTNPVQTPNGWEREYPLYSFSCPSIIYHEGYFWMLANSSQSVNGQLQVSISNSRDLVNWSDPRLVQISVPDGYHSNGNGGFDAVAADWAVAPDGNIYMAVSIGRYGAYWGDPENDQMYPYMVKFTQLQGHNDPEYNPIGNDENYIDIQVEQAKPILLPQSSSDRIDGSWYFEDSTAYLSIKNNGVTNEIWSTPVSNLSKSPSQVTWTKVCGDVITGYEAPSLTKFDGLYFMYTDELATWTPSIYERQPYYRTGTNVQVSTSLSNGWQSPSLLRAYNSKNKSYTISEMNNELGDGPRHGTVITVTDPAAKKVIWELRNQQGYQYSSPVFWDVNQDHWGYTVINACAEEELMNGYAGSKNFGPDDSMNRAQAAAVLSNYFNPGESTESNQTGLPDVESYQWYTRAANWAVKNKIINGYDDGRFAPYDSLTREQFCTILASSAVSFLGANLSACDYTTFNNMPDSSSVSDWAKESVAWCMDKKIINGVDGRIDPQGTMSRAMMAAMIQNAINQGVL